MRITKKIISLLLAVIMVCGTMAGLSVLTVSAADTTTNKGDTTTPGGEVVEETHEEKLMKYLTEPYASPDEKLATMEEMYAKGNYVIYADERSGEVAVKDIVTGQVMFTNPYDVAISGSTENIKTQLMSQLVVTYLDNGKENVFYSFNEAALRNQITVKNIRGGVRVEYTIGREQARRLVPQWIEKSRFDTLIRPLVEKYYASYTSSQWWVDKFTNWYSYKSLDDCETDALKAEMMNTYPCTGSSSGKGLDIYVFDPTAKEFELSQIEEIIKAACPDYTYDELDYDHQLTGYVSKDENPPVFKMALEYTINEDGFSVRLPANGIRFNQSRYQLENISILPYMGAGNNNYTGYTFYPDGSGALFTFEDLADEDTYSVSGSMYGTDYAYHTLSGGAYQQDVRYPVFGMVENTLYYDSADDNGTVRMSGVVYDLLKNGKPEGMKDSDYKAITEKYKLSADSDPTKVPESHGYLAIIEEGDALAELTYAHSGVLSPYDSIKMDFNPRPKDSYNLADSISVGSNSEWTVVSSRKYVGSYRIRYIMLTDEKLAQSKEADQPDTWKWYAAEWMGMAEAYRSYLVSKGVLTSLYDNVADDQLKDIPLYIETFGAIEATEKILSVPVDVQKALTTFDDVKTMYVELLAKQVTNINFKLTGYYNGGLYSSMPYKLDWEDVLSKETDFQALLNFSAEIEAGNYDNLKAYAKEILSEDSYASLEAFLNDPDNKGAIKASLGIFPDFEFSYTDGDEWFDGLDLRDHAVRTIDDRYTSKRMYSATQQKYIGYYQLAISPAYFSHFYEELMDNYKAYDNVTGISVGSLGTDLNSDFDEDEPYNREDSKSFVAKALEYFNKQDLEVMVDGGNAYTWKYVDHVLNAPLDSSRYILASYSVPFMGVVLHGYVDFAGSPLNMEGDVAYATLKAIENGASVYFTLSYQNTQLLKEDKLYSEYYSVRYDIWFDDVVELYNRLNADMKDVQNDIIVDHEFLSGVRLPDADELRGDVDSYYNAIQLYREELARYEEQMKTEAVANARDQVSDYVTVASKFITTCLNRYSAENGALDYYYRVKDNFQTRLVEYMEADAIYRDVLAQKATLEATADPDEQELQALTAALNAATKKRQSAERRLDATATRVTRALEEIRTGYENLLLMQEAAQAGKLLIQQTNELEGLPASVMAEVDAYLAEAEKILARELGLTFDQSIEKMELDTFLKVHVSQLINDAMGGHSATAAGAIGRAENLYELWTTKNYGIKNSAAALTLLKTIAANKGMSDADLIEKYDLQATGSKDALLQVMKELLGKHGFDALLTEEEVNENLVAYFEQILLGRILTLAETNTEVLPALNVLTTKLNDRGETVTDDAVVAALANIDVEIMKVLNPLISAVADGNYRMDDHVTNAQMKDLVQMVIGILEKAEATYKTPDTMEDDIQDRVEALYYQAVLKKYTADQQTVKLQIQTNLTSTSNSISMLYNMMASHYFDGESIVEWYAAMANDSAAFARLDDLAALLGGYKTVDKNDLYNAYKQLFAGDKELGFALKSENIMFYLSDALNTLETALDGVAVNLIDVKKSINADGTRDEVDYVVALRQLNILIKAQKNEAAKTALQAFAAEIQKCIDLTNAIKAITLNGVKLDKDVTIDELSALAEQAEQLVATSGLATMDVGLNAEEYVYFTYCRYLSGDLISKDDKAKAYIPVYYYNADMAGMDDAVRTATKDKADALRAALGTEATAFDAYELILQTLANDNADIVTLTKQISEAWDMMLQSGYNSDEVVKNYYTYLLFLQLSDYLLDNEVPALPFDRDGKMYTNAVNAANLKIDQLIDAMMRNAVDAANGGTIDYSWSFQTTELNVDLDAMVNEVFTYLVEMEHVSSGDRDEFLPTLKDYFMYTYYATILEDALDVDQAPKFNLIAYEVYVENEVGFYESSRSLQELVNTYVVTFSDLTEEDIKPVVGQETDTEDDDNKYVSDDGRIVAVTYGETKGEPAKTFILNYNKFSVRVNYTANGVEKMYTIPAYGYVVVEYDHGN